jgi:hypothetical protein
VIVSQLLNCASIAGLMLEKSLSMSNIGTSLLTLVELARNRPKMFLPSPKLSTTTQYPSFYSTSHQPSKEVKMANVLNNIAKWAVPVAIGGSLVNQSLYDVKGGTRAVIFDRLSGVKDTVVSEGTHFLIPWLQKSIIYDVRTKPRNISTTTGSKDLQMVSLTLRVLHRPEVQALPKIYQVCLFL